MQRLIIKQIKVWWRLEFLLVLLSSGAMKKLSQQELLLSFLIYFIKCTILRDTCNSNHERLTCMFPVGGGSFILVADVWLYVLYDAFLVAKYLCQCQCWKTYIWTFLGTFTSTVSRMISFSKQTWNERCIALLLLQFVVALSNYIWSIYLVTAVNETVSRREAHMLTLFSISAGYCTYCVFAIWWCSCFSHCALPPTEYTH